MAGDKVGRTEFHMEGLNCQNNDKLIAACITNVIYWGCISDTPEGVDSLMSQHNSENVVGCN